MKDRSSTESNSGYFEPLEKRDFLSADLTGSFPSLGAVVYAPGAAPTVDFVFKNVGDEKAKLGTVTFVARPDGETTSAYDIVLGTGKGSGFLNAGAETKTLRFKLAVPANAAPGANYNLVGIIGNGADANDTIVGGDLTISTPSLNLTTAIDEVKLPTSVLEGATVKGTVKISVARTGDSPLPKNPKVDIKLFLRKEGGGDTLIATFNARSLSSLKSGKPMVFTTAVTLNSLATGTYRLYSVVDEPSVNSPTGAITENNDTLEDNTSPLSTFSITAAPAFSDLSIIGQSTTGTSATTTSKHSSSVTIKNEGNTNVDGKVNIKFFATANGVITQDSIAVGSLDNQSLKLTAGASSKPFKANLDFSGLGAATYTIVARVDTVSGITDTNAANNAHVVSGPVTITLAPGVLGDIGDVVTLVTTDSGSNVNGYAENGSFRTSRGVQGIYSYIRTVPLPFVGSVATFSLTIFTPQGGQVAIALRITSRNPPENLFNKVLTFSNTSGSIAWEGAVPFYGFDQRRGKFSIGVM